MDIKKLIETTKNLNVLFVEDDVDALNEASKIFKRFFNKVDLAKDGVEGLELFKKNGYDLVITDISMPRMNGFEMLKAIKAIKSDTYTLVITAFNETDYYLEAIQIGVDGFILKPINLEQLMSVFSKIALNFTLKQQAEKYFSLLTQYQAIVDKSALVCKVDKNGFIGYVNEEFAKSLGYSADEIKGKKFFSLIKDSKGLIKDILKVILKQNGIWSGVLKLLSKENKIIYIKASVKAILDEGVERFIFIGYDISEVMKPKKFLLDYINNHINPVLGLIEIENFENLRNLFGENFTEGIEKKFEELLKNMVPKEIDEIYTLEDGVFALVANGMHIDFEEFSKKIAFMQERINNSILEINGLKYDISILVSLSEGKHCFDNAREGLQILKKEKRNFIIAKDLIGQIKKRAENNLKVLHILKEAINNNDIVCAYQPIVDNTTLQPVKYEALVRIKKGNVLIPPGEFLDIAKEGSFYSQLTTIIITYSIQKLKELNNVSINISEIDIEKESVRSFIYELLEQNRDLASRITFELLEDEDIEKYEKLDEFIEKIKNFGVKIAIDDFGSGYSNFYRLKQYRPDYLKIDGSLIKDIHKDNFSYTIVKSIVEFAKANDIKTIAEYVENEEIFKKLKEIGVDYSQGYYFGKPVLL
jgi:PAS domain S-box-containing protein